MLQTGQAGIFTGSRLAAKGLIEAGLVGVGQLRAGLAGSKGSVSERKRVEAVVETLASLRGESESLAAVAHDARNMVTALGLYCDLLEEPGVLFPAFHHYGNELRMVATASRRLVEKLVALDLRLGLAADLGGEARTGTEALDAGRQERTRRFDLLPAEPINNLAGEVLANRNLLAALAGPSITLTVDAEGGSLPVRLTGEDLTRILVNLVKNAAEAMPEGGCILIGLRERSAADGAVELLALTVEDNGPGIPKNTLDKIFDYGYTTRAGGGLRHGGRPTFHRGLGLSITRSIVASGGGCIHAANRAPSGARFEIELPVRSR